MVTTREIGPGWYPAPGDPLIELFWDGHEWTDRSRAARSVDSDGSGAMSPGWYPKDERVERFWDGRKWGETRQRSTEAAADGDSRPVALDTRVLLVGRSSACDIRLEDPTVSSHHANIVEAGGRFQVIDMSSSNGTFVNGRRVRASDVVEGDEIHFGLCRTELRGGKVLAKPLER